MTKLTWKDVDRACGAYNRAKGFTEWNSIGRLSFGDVGGFGGRFVPRLWVVINDRGGVGRAYDLQGTTHAKTIENINRAAFGVTLANDPARPWFPAAQC